MKLAPQTHLPVRQAPRVRRGFIIGWLSITIATATVFGAFVGPLFQNGEPAMPFEQVVPASTGLDLL